MWDGYWNSAYLWDSRQHYSLKGVTSSIRVCSSFCFQLFCEWESSGVPRRGSNCRFSTTVEAQQYFPVHRFQPTPLELMWECIQSRAGFFWSVNIATTPSVAGATTSREFWLAVKMCRCGHIGISGLQWVTQCTDQDVLFIKDGQHVPA